RFNDQQSRLSSGATATQVAAELQGAIGTMAGNAGLNVLSSQILKEEDTDGFRRVGVRLTLSGSLDGVTRLLSAIEGGDKDMVVTHLEINRKLGTTRRPPTSRAGSPPEPTVAPLTVSLEVRTFMRQQT
ncbi:MAG TPA: type II secretion system protein GspM, partial [Candidatus Binatia bacterium]|nr:type II secretion system protein GspM [Candidatus Binatia bacterium]